MSEKRKKKKKERQSSDTRIRRVVPVPVSNTDTTPKMACPCNLVPKSFKDRLDEGGLDFDEGGLDFDEVQHVPSYLNAMANDW